MNDTILIVDDSSFIVDGLVAILKKKYRTLAAYSGEDCLAILRKETPSIIILDVMMEPIDGWETLTRIREDAATRWTPVLMFSARKLSPEEAEKHLVRLDDFIQKPVSPKKIIESIEKVLTRRAETHEVIEAWTAAGVLHEMIEEYLTLTTSLEVDLSLCQNLRLQYNLASPLDGSQTEFRSLMDAIEKRIVQERTRITAMEQEMNAFAGRSAGNPREAVPESGETAPAVPEMPVSMEVVAAEGKTGARISPPETAKLLTEPEQLPPADSVSPGTPLTPASPAGTGIPLLAEPAGVSVPSGFSEEDALFEEEPRASVPGDEPFDVLVPPRSSRPGPASSREKNVAGSLPPDEDPVKQASPAGTLPGRPAPRLGRTGPGSHTAEKLPAGSGESGEFSSALRYGSGTVTPETGGLRGLTDAPSSHGNVAERHLIPAELDIPPIGPDELLTGAGTDIPMPQERLRGRRRPTDQRPVVPAPPVLRKPAAERPAGGILDRIIALFVRKKKP